MIEVASRFSIAPMMDWTDRHCRYFHRVLTRQARLYTEMVTTGAVIHGDRERLLGFSPPGASGRGCSSAGRARATWRRRRGSCADLGYDEINLNVGCPSDRVQAGRFGACLMAEPALVGDCVAAMKACGARAGHGEVPHRHRRPGPRGGARRPRRQRFAAAGVDAFIVHARKAWLKGLSPKENRDIPPLDYARVYRLKAAHPDLPIAINGGVKGPDEWQAHLAHVDGVMIGREAYQNPEILLRRRPRPLRRGAAGRRRLRGDRGDARPMSRRSLPKACGCPRSRGT